MACRILVPDQGSNSCPLKWGHRMLATGSPGKSLYLYVKLLILSFKTHILYLIIPWVWFFCVYVFFPPACTRSHFVSLCILWFLTSSWYMREWFEALLTSFSWEDVYLALSGIWGTSCHRHLYTKYSTWSLSFLLHSMFTEANLLHPLGGGTRWIYFSVHTYVEDIEPHWGSNFM